MAHDRQQRVAVAAGAAALALLAACTPNPDRSEPVTTAPSAETPTITPPTASPSPEVEAARAAEQAVAAYYDTTDELLSNPELPIEQAGDVATGAELDEVRQLVQQERADGRRQNGQVVVATLEVTTVDLTPPATANIQICLDVSGVDVINATGTSVVAPGRQPRSVIDLDLIEQDPTGWVVERTQSQGASCDGS